MFINHLSAFNNTQYQRGVTLDHQNIYYRTPPMVQISQDSSCVCIIICCCCSCCGHYHQYKTKAETALILLLLDTVILLLLLPCCLCAQHIVKCVYPISHRESSNENSEFFSIFFSQCVSFRKTNDEVFLFLTQLLRRSTNQIYSKIKNCAAKG